MKKVLATVGIGNATVDTVLASETVQPGETVDAEIRVEGGNAEQEVRHIDLEFETYYHTEDGRREGTVDTARLTDGFTIEPDESRTIDTQVEIPWGTPLTMGGVDVWLETELDVTGIDPEDEDYLDVRPTDRQQAVFDAAESLGLSLRTAKNEEVAGWGSNRFVQEFEFTPSGGPFRGDLDEIELIFDPGPDSLRVAVEVDRRGGLLAEMTDTDERTDSFAVETADAGAVERDLRQIIERHT
ncbi:sporulation protein [Haloglomus litoreum]|uniref:sporulation protein n=1 Tax=Haloglomus litoreum TaxID=3034026 RepID=UPI0023E86DC7|nr:sporulation protein [Haloglomus sp. DT116]